MVDPENRPSMGLAFRVPAGSEPKLQIFAGGRDYHRRHAEGP